MNERSGTLRLNLFLRAQGLHHASWRRDAAPPARAVLGIDHYLEQVQLAEAAFFDSAFIADSPALNPNPWDRLSYPLEPTVLLAALAARTRTIGLIVTASTSYWEPFVLARVFSTIDHLSAGRIGWNIVTTAGDAAARNHGSAAVAPPAERYARAEEFVRAAIALWESWDDNALVGDRESGVLVEPEAIRPVRVRGEHLQVEGRFTAPRSPQSRPLLVQAGLSEEGIALAGRFADAVFSVIEHGRQGREYYDAVKQAALRAGRDPESVLVLPGIAPIIGATEAEALRIRDGLDERTGPEQRLDQLSGFLGVDVRGADIDAGVPVDELAGALNGGTTSRGRQLLETARRDGLSYRELSAWFQTGRGHIAPVGTPEQIADVIEHAWRERHADGFNLMPPSLPDQLELFVREVLPILRRRGLARTEPGVGTLRERYTPRPQAVSA